MKPAQTTDNTFPLYTIYYNTADWPGEYVIKRWLLSAPRDESDEPKLLYQDMDYRFNASTLEACRKELEEKGLNNLGRQDNDDKVIVESWM